MLLFQVYRAQIRTSAAVELQYRAALVIWLIGLILEPVIYLVVWSAVARSGGGQVGGYTGGDFAAYFIVLMMVNHVTFTWVMYEFDTRIRQGSFSPLLLRPIHPIHADIAENITYKGITLIVMLPAAMVLASGFHAQFHTKTWMIAAFVPALLLAFAVRFLVEWTLALSAFWVERSAAVNQVYAVAVLFLSGQMAPLSLLPAPIRLVANMLPFRWMVSFPVELLLGRLTPTEAMMGFGAQAAWLLGSFLMMRLVWRAGIRRYSAVGS
ncbi:MAG: ABC-2 family transporter protein [Armatimonadota bacterium]|nr:ABC-2 family transporter protein [Armatimonadota bacterium]